MAKGARERPGSTDAYPPSPPGYMPGCSFTLTDRQKMLRKPARNEQWQKVPGATDSTNTYSPSTPSYMPGCSFTLTDRQKMLRKPARNERWQKVPGATDSTNTYSPSTPGYMTGCGFHIFARCHSWRGRREAERKTTAWLLVRLYGCTGASGRIVHLLRARRPATRGHQWPLAK